MDEGVNRGVEGWRHREMKGQRWKDRETEG